MIEQVFKVLGLGIAGGVSMIAAAVPPEAVESDWWVPAAREFGVVGLTLVLSVLFLGYVTPKLLAAVMQFLKEEREERAKIHEKFIEAQREARDDFRDMLHANQTAIVGALEKQNALIAAQSQTFTSLAIELKSRPCQQPK